MATVDAVYRELCRIVYGDTAECIPDVGLNRALDLFARLDDHLLQGGPVPSDWQGSRTNDSPPDKCEMVNMEPMYQILSGFLTYLMRARW